MPAGLLTKRAVANGPAHGSRVPQSGQRGGGTSDSSTPRVQRQRVQTN